MGLTKRPLGELMLFPGILSGGRGGGFVFIWCAYVSSISVNIFSLWGLICISAVRAIYESNEIVTGVDRPLPDEVKHMKAPHYRRIQVCIIYNHFSRILLVSSSVRQWLMFTLFIATLEMNQQISMKQSTYFTRIMLYAVTTYAFHVYYAGDGNIYASHMWHLVYW